jgi:hypothetical protein
MSMSPVLRPGPSSKIHTQESFFWFRKRPACHAFDHIEGVKTVSIDVR